MTSTDYINKTTNEFFKWVGYCEKSSYSAVANATYDNPGGYTTNAGSNNYTVFAKVYYEKTGINVQSQAWCDTFVDTIYIHLYGVELAKKLLGDFSAYTPTSSNYFKAMQQWYTSNPKAGDIIFFKNDTRICHTGYVYAADNTYVYTVEGNTSPEANKVVPNGGQVAKKHYLKNNSRIAGYGRPNYQILVDAAKPNEYIEGWFKAADNVRWWYQFKDGTYAAKNSINNGWYKIDGFWYMFDENGFMMTGVQKCKDSTGEHLYAFCSEVGKDEGKCMISDANGVLTPLKV